MDQHTDSAPTAKPYPLTKAEFGRRAGRTKQSISEACKGPLAPALMPSGKLDANHGAAHAWCVKRGIDLQTILGVTPQERRPEHEQSEPNEAERKSTPRSTRGAAEPAAEIEADQLPEMTLRQITDEFGSIQGFQEFLDARKTAAAIRQLELKNFENDGRLISREFVRVHVFGLIENTNRRLLGDLPKTLSKLIAGAVRANHSQEQIEIDIRDRISSVLEHVKTKARKTLAEQHRPTNNDDDEQDDNPGGGEGADHAAHARAGRRPVPRRPDD